MSVVRKTTTIQCMYDGIIMRNSGHAQHENHKGYMQQVSNLCWTCEKIAKVMSNMRNGNHTYIDSDNVRGYGTVISMFADMRSSRQYVCACWRHIMFDIRYPTDFDSHECCLCSLMSIRPGGMKDVLLTRCVLAHSNLGLPVKHMGRNEFYAAPLEAASSFAKLGEMSGGFVGALTGTGLGFLAGGSCTS